MDEKSIGARWRENHWDCKILDALIEPGYFNPPISPTGKVIQYVVAFHRDFPYGRTFLREGSGKPWVRKS